MLESYIQQLAQEFELTEGFEPQSPGVYIIPFEDGFQIKIVNLPQGVLINCAVIACPPHNREKFLTQVMLANLFGQGTRDGILSLSEDGNMLTLSREVNYNPEYREFRDMLEDFITVVDFWREEAQTHA